MKVNFNILIIINIIILIFILVFRLCTFTENFTQVNTDKIAFLFLTYNNLKKLDIWNNNLYLLEKSMVIQKLI